MNNHKFVESNFPGLALDVAAGRHQRLDGVPDVQLLRIYVCMYIYIYITTTNNNTNTTNNNTNNNNTNNNDNGYDNNDNNSVPDVQLLRY